jgi:hypothetical protein
MPFLKRQTVEVRHSVFHYSKAIGLDRYIVGHGQIELGSRCRPSHIGFAQERAFVFRTKRTTHGSINTRKLRLFKRPDGIYGTSIGDPLMLAGNAGAGSHQKLAEDFLARLDRTWQQHPPLDLRRSLPSTSAAGAVRVLPGKPA